MSIKIFYFDLINNLKCFFVVLDTCTKSLYQMKHTYILNETNVLSFLILYYGRLNGDVLYNGIDRIDNNVSYIPSNVVPCCGQCNRAKDVSTTKEFLTWVTAIYNHMKLGDSA